MKQITIIGIVAICVIATFGTTYLSVNAVKDQEIHEMEEQHESEINGLVYTLNAVLENLTSQQNKSSEVNKFVGTWNRSINGTISEYPRFSRVFSSDGTYWLYMTGLPYRWDVIGENWLIISVWGEIVEISEYSFSDNYTTLELTSIGTHRNMEIDGEWKEVFILEKSNYTTVYKKYTTSELDRFVGTWDVEVFLFYYEITFFSNRMFKKITYQPSEGLGPTVLSVVNGTYNISTENVEEPYQGTLFLQFLNETDTLISRSHKYYFSNDTTLCLFSFSNWLVDTCFTKQS